MINRDPPAPKHTQPHLPMTCNSYFLGPRESASPHPISGPEPRVSSQMRPTLLSPLPSVHVALYLPIFPFSISVDPAFPEADSSLSSADHFHSSFHSVLPEHSFVHANPVLLEPWSSFVSGSLLPTAGGSGEYLNQTWIQ